MDKQDKIQLITNLCNAVRDEVLKRVVHMPDEWDGFELREYVADLFNQERFMSQRSHKATYRKRLRTYKNETITRMGL